MADIHLEPGESLIGQGMMAYWEPVRGSSCDVWRGTIFVTNQKVCFRISWTSHMEFELKLSEIRGYTVGKLLFASKVAIHSKSEEKFTVTGFPVKKLQGCQIHQGTKCNVGNQEGQGSVEGHKGVICLHR